MNKKWTDLTQFHVHDESELRTHLSEAITKHKSERPIVLLDLDSTLYHVQPRTFEIVRQWVDGEDSELFKGELEALSKLELRHVGYSLRETFRALKLDPDLFSGRAAFESAKKFWDDRFFTNEFLKYDLPYEGAPEFVNQIYSEGAHLVYLTGRDWPGMGDATLSNLKRDGFPIERERTELMMKNTRFRDDSEFKEEAVNEILSQGKLICSFENEPKNIVMIQKLAPSALHVFLDTVHSDHPVESGREIYRVTDFRKLLR